MATTRQTAGPRQAELALIERIDSRLDKLAEDVTDVRERVIRIESQDVTAKLNALEVRTRVLEEWRARVAGQVTLFVIPIAAAVGAVIKAAGDFIFR